MVDERQTIETFYTISAQWIFGKKDAWITNYIELTKVCLSDKLNNTDSFEALRNSPYNLKI